MLGGGLIAFALGHIIMFQVFLHHMFIVGVRSPASYIACATPVLLVIAGVVIGIRALSR